MESLASGFGLLPPNFCFSCVFKRTFHCSFLLKTVASHDCGAQVRPTIPEGHWHTSLAVTWVFQSEKDTVWKIMMAGPCCLPAFPGEDISNVYSFSKDKWQREKGFQRHSLCEVNEFVGLPYRALVSYLKGCGHTLYNHPFWESLTQYEWGFTVDT